MGRWAGLTLGIALGTASVVARADQCAWVPEKQARAAAERLHPGDKVRDFCEPCNEKGPGRARLVRSVDVRRVKSAEEYWELVVNGQPVDFAYLFVESREEPGRFDNVARLSDCPATGVSPSIKPSR